MKISGPKNNVVANQVKLINYKELNYITTSQQWLASSLKCLLKHLSNGHVGFDHRYPQDSKKQKLARRHTLSAI